MATAASLAIGTRVQIFDYEFGDTPLDGTVVIINDPVTNPGKWIGVQLDNSHPRANQLDLKLDANGQPYKDANGNWVGNVEMGFGMWTRPEYVAVVA